jgi:hypothetical protein
MIRHPNIVRAMIIVPSSSKLQSNHQACITWFLPIIRAHAISANSSSFCSSFVSHILGIGLPAMHQNGTESNKIWSWGWMKMKTIIIISQDVVVIYIDCSGGCGGVAYPANFRAIAAPSRLWSWAIFCDSSMLLTDVGRAIWTAVQNRIRPHHLARSFYEFLENRIVPISISTSNVTICPFPFPKQQPQWTRGTAAWYGSLD